MITLNMILMCFSNLFVGVPVNQNTEKDIFEIADIFLLAFSFSKSSWKSF
jgi:hypothetical protein